MTRIAVSTSSGWFPAFKKAWIIVMVLATSVPYLVNAALAPEGFRYAWVLPPYPSDLFAYMAWSRQAYHGCLLFQLKYTALPHEPFFFNPFFLIVGWLGALTGLDIGFLHFLLRAAGVALFFLIFFRALCTFGLDERTSVVAAILVGTSSGFGWLLEFLMGRFADETIRPVDLWLVDSNTFWSLLWNPLYPFSLSLLVLFVERIELGSREPKPGYFWAAGLFLGLLTLIHPYYVPALAALAAVVTAIRLKGASLPGLARIFAVSFLPVLYVFVVSKFHPLLSKHNIVGELKSPHFLATLAGFGWPLVLATVGLLVGPRVLLKKRWSLLLWIVISLTFSYLPFWYQRKFIFGVHLPICVLAALSFNFLLSKVSDAKMRRHLQGLAVVLLLPLAVSTNMAQLRSHRKTVRQNQDQAFYLDQRFLEAMKFLRQHSRPDELVFATEYASTLIAAYAGNTVLWGHWAMSVDYRKRQAWFTNVFDDRSGWSDDRRKREFWGAGITYFLFDGVLKQWFEETRPPWLADHSEEVFKNDAFVLYKKRKDTH